MGRIVERICQIGEVVKQSNTHLLVSEQYAGVDELEQHKKWTVLFGHESISELEERIRKYKLCINRDFWRSLV
jgi:hypothetical protein